jgi:transcription elongation factor Elf1
VREEGKIICLNCGDAVPVQIDLLTEEVDAYAQYIDAKLGTKKHPRKSNKEVFGDSFFD